MGNDNGGDRFATNARDERWENEEPAAIKRIKGQDLEVIRTGPLTTG